MSAVLNDRKKYQLKARAARQQQTRARIVAATASLHEEVGPARTTLAEIARRAGVQRLTVYNNFPKLGDLLRACQSHFLASHPPPDPAPPEGARSPAQLEQALVQTYRWYRANQAMERHVHRDRHLVPELDELLRESLDPALQAGAAAWARTLTDGPKARQVLMQLIRVAFDFRTWALLADGGASDPEIAGLFRRSANCLRSARSH